MRLPFGWCAAAVIATVLAANGVAGAAGRPAASLNPGNDKLLKMPPAQRSAVLAKVVGHWCIGTETSLMGVIQSGAGEGNAYWSVRCADGSAWAVQLNPDETYVAIDCAEYKAVGDGKECFKKF